jgi:AbiU2
MTSPRSTTIASGTPEQQFERELEIFRTEAETAAQFFYTYLAMHEVAKRHKPVFHLFNEHPLFWNTLVGGVQTAALIAVGRVFDQDSPHNVDAVLGLAQRHRDIFAKAALGKRKQGNAREQPDWLPDYLRTAYEPTPEDFRRLRKLVKKHRRCYETNYRDLRNQYYAHKQAADPADVQRLVAKTNIREMQRMFTFLLQLHQTLQELFSDGRKPVLRPVRYSAARIKQKPSTAVPGEAVHERITQQAEQALRCLAQRARKPAAKTSIEDARTGEWNLQESQTRKTEGMIAPNAHERKEMLERETGVEPATSSLGSRG